MNLKNELIQRRISQSKLSVLTGINYSQLNAALNGNQKMFPSWKLKIAKALGDEVEFLFPKEEEEYVK